MAFSFDRASARPTAVNPAPFADFEDSMINSLRGRWEAQLGDPSVSDVKKASIREQLRRTNPEVPWPVGAEPSVGPQRLMALMTEEVEGGFRGRPVVMPAFQKDERRAVGEFYQDPALAGPPGGAHERAFLTVPAATQAQTERCAARAARRRRDDDSLPAVGVDGAAGGRAARATARRRRALAPYAQSGGLERLKEKHFPVAECVRQKRESTLERVRRGDERASGGAMKDRNRWPPSTTRMRARHGGSELGRTGSRSRAPGLLCAPVHPKTPRYGARQPVLVLHFSARRSARAACSPLSRRTDAQKASRSRLSSSARAPRARPFTSTTSAPTAGMTVSSSSWSTLSTSPPRARVAAGQRAQLRDIAVDDALDDRLALVVATVGEPLRHDLHDDARAQPVVHARGGRGGAARRGAAALLVRLALAVLRHQPLEVRHRLAAAARGAAARAGVARAAAAALRQREPRDAAEAHERLFEAAGAATATETRASSSSRSSAVGRAASPPSSARPDARASATRARILALLARLVVDVVLALALERGLLRHRGRVAVDPREVPPFSVSSTTALPLLPRYRMKLVSVSHLVEFMCTCCLSWMYSWYTTFECTRFVPCRRESTSRKFCSNSLEYVCITLPGFSAKMRICRRCPSLVWWHLKPFSSRHCFEHISHHQRSFCSPLLLMRFPIALGERKSCFGIRTKEPEPSGGHGGGSVVGRACTPRVGGELIENREERCGPSQQIHPHEEVMHAALTCLARRPPSPPTRASAAAGRGDQCEGLVACALPSPGGWIALFSDTLPRAHPRALAALPPRARVRSD